MRLRIEPEVNGVKVLFANHNSFGKGAWKINKENMALISNLWDLQYLLQYMGKNNIICFLGKHQLQPQYNKPVSIQNAITF